MDNLQILHLEFTYVFVTIEVRYANVLLFCFIWRASFNIGGTISFSNNKVITKLSCKIFLMEC